MVGYALPQKPSWLEALLCEKFFLACSKHGLLKKNERNIFCVDCNGSICQHCLSCHNSHRLVQIRRYVYHDVIRLHDMQKFVDCGQVQTYIINSARVVFLNQRPQPRPAKNLGNSCDNCDRSLQDSYRYCSVSCKVDAAVKRKKDLSFLLPSCEFAAETYNCSSGEEMEGNLSPNCVLDETQSQTSSLSMNADAGDGYHQLAAVTSSAPKRIRSSKCSPQFSPKSIIPSSRRKGTPHRSPFS